MHIDVNSAYLSWEAAYRMQQGSSLDLRDIPSVIGGDVESRHGIVLAKSIPAKKYNIQTGETLFSARQKCPELIVIPPHYELYMMASNAMIDILNDYTPAIQRFSVDEMFLDFTSMEYHYPDPIELAYSIKDRIKHELGFTVSIGISNNKLLAKMGSDLKKPDAVTTLYPDEISKKMWPLPVEDLFMVGRATAPKLHKLNIFTIGDLAAYDSDILKSKLKSHGIVIWNFANGNENSDVRKSNVIDVKGIGNSTTISFDVTDRKEAHLILLSLCEMVGMRLRHQESCCNLVAISIKSHDFISYSRQRKLYYPIDSTAKIWRVAAALFDEVWKGEPVRNLGVRASELCTNEFIQTTMFDDKDIEKTRDLDNTIDKVRLKYGTAAIIRGSFLHSGLSPINGGIGEESYPVMTSIL
ncbi:DNA polymerase Y family protein [Oxobacter pfennigii]|nr:DNA polymerase IV [Oxobacter pfennigii]